MKVLWLLTIILASAYGCAPRPPYRTPISPSAGKPPITTSAKPPPAAPLPSPTTTEPAPRPLPLEGKIREQDLKPREQASAPPAAQKEPLQPPVLPDTTAPVPPLMDDSSLLAKLTPTTPPQRAASLRLTDEGRKLLDGGDYARALERFERAIAIDSSNAYAHYFLAKTQNRLKHYKESLNFLDVAESRLSGEPFWLAEVYALRGDNFRALGMNQRAEASYSKALSINSGNKTAGEAMHNYGDNQPAQR
jgi:hypothetical protein